MRSKKKKARTRRAVLDKLSALPVQFHCKLELARIVGRGRLTCIGKQRAYCSDVIFIRDIEHVDDEVGAETLGERNALRDAHVPECGPGRDSCIAAQVAIKLQQRGGHSSRIRSTRHEWE